MHIRQNIKTTLTMLSGKGISAYKINEELEN